LGDVRLEMAGYRHGAPSGAFERDAAIARDNFSASDD
jgi:hypothetical protein